jgi:phenylpropionate dioxygenase-like ring-hydroxylating dioxygenase large terminal subunit
MITREAFGTTKKLYCVYHAWSYTLKGDLSHAAFSQGLRGEGGLPKDFSLADHGLQKLRVETLCGLVFATFSNATPPLLDWLGDVAHGIRRVLNKPLKVLGYDTQRIHANWKAYHENPRDSYHANILHTFYGTFGLSRMSQESGMILDKSGRHVYFYTKAGTEKKSEDYEKTSSQLRSHNDGLKLEDPSILKWQDEYGDGVSVQILTTYPGFVLHQIANSLATRQICTKGPGQTDLVWTYFGFEDDDEALTERRLAQTNLAGSAGMISVEDAAVCEMMQHAVGDAQEGASFIEMGGKEVKFELDENGKPLGVYFKEQKDANKLIEEYMLLANKEVAKFIKSKELPCVNRVHPTPDDEKLLNLKKMALNFGHELEISDPETTKDELNKLIKKIKDTPEENILSTLVIRSMKKAYYSTEEIGHYGLDFEDYSHFTSPIRRYSDVFSHRLLSLALGNDGYPKK